MVKIAPVAALSGTTRVAAPTARVRPFIEASLHKRPPYTPLSEPFQPRFDEATSGILRRRILKLMTLQRVAQLVVAKTERGRGRALVEAVSAQRFLEQLALIGRDGTA